MVDWSMLPYYYCYYYYFFCELGLEKSLSHWPAAKKCAAGGIGF
jgi:hypothetical protein